MVSISMGKLWGGKVEEIANLKAENQEIKEELQETKEKLEALEGEMEGNRKLKNDAEAKLLVISTEYSVVLESSVIQEQIINELAQLKTVHEDEISSLKSNLSALQVSLDTTAVLLSHSQKLEQDLRAEIKQGEKIRNELEKERNKLQEELAQRDHDLEVMKKAKEHSDRHIAILVKEKDRIVNKSDSKPSVTSKIFETVVEEKVISWGQVENQRLKALLEEERKEGELQKAQIEKLQKENWNLINRLRNKK